MATIGYVAFLAGPPLIGFLADDVGTLNALTATGGLVALGLLVSGALREPAVPVSEAVGAPVTTKRVDRAGESATTRPTR